MRPRPQLRARHPITDDEEHAFLVAGSRLFNAGSFYETHEEWEEVWRRSAGPRREMLRGLIQVSVGYEHLRRGNLVGACSLLRQGIRRLGPHARKPGVRELRAKAAGDLRRIESDERSTVRTIRPPKVMVCLRGRTARAPASAIRVEVPLRRRRGPAAAGR